MLVYNEISKGKTMKVIKIVNQKYGQNSYLVISDDSAILIDANANVGQIEEYLKIYNPRPKLKAIFITHEHYDHIGELDNIIAKYKCNAYIHADGKASLYKEDQNLSVFDDPFKIKTKKEIKTFKDGEELTFDDITIKCYHTPGHSNGSSCFVIGSNMFVGDTVFKINIGRTDLYGGDENKQKISLRRILNDLSHDIIYFYPGHSLMFDREDLKYNLSHYLGEN